MKYSRNEEIANSLTHAAGIILGIAVGILFIVRFAVGGDAWVKWSLVLYLFGMQSSYLASTTYHALPDGKSKAVLRKWDHSAIYWHIAGSYSPVTLLALRAEGAWGITLFCAIWGVAIAGTIPSFINLKHHSHIQTVSYVLLGLTGVIAFGPLWRAAGAVACLWIIAEGVMYITGAVFYSIYKKPYMHTIFHVFVLLGTICHLVALWNIFIQYCSL